MFWFKSCPHCRGDLYEDKDLYGWYVTCLQCGYYLGAAEELVLRGPSGQGLMARSGEAAPATACVENSRQRQGFQPLLTPLEMGVKSA